MNHLGLMKCLSVTNSGVLLSLLMAVALCRVEPSNHRNKEAILFRDIHEHEKNIYENTL